MSVREAEAFDIKIVTLTLPLSEFLAEESQEKFWDFVEANQNIEGEHDGNVKSLSHSSPLLSLFVSALPAAEFMMQTKLLRSIRCVSVFFFVRVCSQQKHFEIELHTARLPCSPGPLAHFTTDHKTHSDSIEILKGK